MLQREILYENFLYACMDLYACTDDTFAGFYIVVNAVFQKSAFQKYTS